MIGRLSVVRRWCSPSVGGPSRGHGFSRAASISKHSGFSPRSSDFSIVFQLLRITFEISTSLGHRVSAELLQRAPCQSKRHHSFPSYPSRRHNTHIGTLIRGFYRLTRREVH